MQLQFQASTIYALRAASEGLTDLLVGQPRSHHLAKKILGYIVPGSGRLGDGWQIS